MPFITSFVRLLFYIGNEGRVRGGIRLFGVGGSVDFGARVTGSDCGSRSVEGAGHRCICRWVLLSVGGCCCL